MTRHYQTLEEIENCYPNEWVLIDEPATAACHQLLGGYVVSHDIDKTAIFKAMKKLPRPYNIAVRYIGDVIEPGEEILLNVDLVQ